MRLMRTQLIVMSAAAGLMAEPSLAADLTGGWRAPCNCAPPVAYRAVEAPVYAPTYRVTPVYWVNQGPSYAAPVLSPAGPVVTYASPSVSYAGAAAMVAGDLDEAYEDAPAYRFYPGYEDGGYRTAGYAAYGVYPSGRAHAWGSRHHRVGWSGRPGWYARSFQGTHYRYGYRPWSGVAVHAGRARWGMGAHANAAPRWHVGTHRMRGGRRR